MKISSHQIQAALDAYVSARKGGAKRTASNPAETPVGALARRIDEMPDERDRLVKDLRNQVLRGRYHVSSTEIVSALLGRLTADLLDRD